jgi:hypothetical protein
MKYLITLLVFTSVSAAYAEDGFRHHQYKTGEVIRYSFEDSDTIFSAVEKDGSVQAGELFRVQEIRIPVKIELISKGKELSRKLTVLPATRYRTASFDTLARTSFEPVTKLSTNVSEAFSYSYKDDTEALNNLQKIFEQVRKDEVGDFLFFKVMDMHQMQESMEKIPEGISPGQTRFYEGHERQGFGGKFIAAPGQLIYQGTETYNGVRAGYFKVVSLGHQFVVPSMNVYTNFTFTMHVALEGPRQGLLLFGEGQETATALKEIEKGKFLPQAIVQRQFSIRLEQ